MSMAASLMTNHLSTRAHQTVRPLCPMVPSSPESVLSYRRVDQVGYSLVMARAVVLPVVVVATAMVLQS